MRLGLRSDEITEGRVPKSTWIFRISETVLQEIRAHAPNRSGSAPILEKAGESPLLP